MRKHADGTEVDMELIVSPDTPTAEHAIFLNAAQCPECGQVLISMVVHDFRQCECPNEAHVDGGRYYLKRGWANTAPIEMSIKFNPNTDHFYRAESEPV